ESAHAEPPKRRSPQRQHGARAAVGGASLLTAFQAHVVIRDGAGQYQPAPRTGHVGVWALTAFEPGMEVVCLRVVVPQAADGVGYEWPARSAALSPVTVIAIIGEEPAGPRGGVHNDGDADDRAQRRHRIFQEGAAQ